MKNVFKLNGFIYIVSEEKLLENDNSWVIDLYLLEKGETNVIFKNKDFGKGTLNYCQKIVLTNDTYLIEDGVQEISPVFLSLFAENPVDELVVWYEPKNYMDVFQGWKYMACYKDKFLSFDGTNQNFAEKGL